VNKKKVLVTGIGGNVGQGILRNIIALNLNIELFGCNTIAFSAGNHFCTKSFEVPLSYDEGYIPAIVKIVEANNIDLIIPSTDFEIYYLSKFKNIIPCTIACSELNATEIYLDKYLSYLHHQKFEIPFAKAYLPSEYNNNFDKSIAKPRKGRGSRGLILNPKNVTALSDDEYMVQELIEGKEITTAFYVTIDGQLLGHISLLRKLENGATSECEVVTEYDHQIEIILNKIIKHSKIRGAANLQFIVNTKNEIYPFEVNCRISGTNSIRSNFGFNDVHYTLQEYLLNKVPQKPTIKKGKAIRILMDIIYPDALSNESYIF
jgi:carbamoyl-phosphate synthase large subunit